MLMKEEMAVTMIGTQEWPYRVAKGSIVALVVVYPSIISNHLETCIAWSICFIPIPNNVLNHYALTDKY